MPLRSLAGKATLAVALAGVAWGGLQSLKTIRANQQIVTITQERNVLRTANADLTARNEAQAIQIRASDAAARQAELGKARALREKEAANEALRQALARNRDWADRPLPPGVRDAINR